MMRKLFKRGMSPIIATILLIAFAVSIGATIISQTGVVWERIRLEDSECSKVLINAFNLEKTKQCENYEFESILKFYLLNETVITPTCYSIVGTGKGDICVRQDLILGSNWAPTSIRIE